MKKIMLFPALFTFLALSSLNLPAVSKMPDEARVTGTLHLGSIPTRPQPPGSVDESGPEPNETGYWLRLDKPIYVLEGTKSEASTNIVVLRVPPGLREKAIKFNERHVVAVGLMNCTGNWSVGASCNMLVKQMDMAE